MLHVLLMNMNVLSCLLLSEVWKLSTVCRPNCVDAAHVRLSIEKLTWC